MYNISIPNCVPEYYREQEEREQREYEEMEQREYTASRNLWKGNKNKVQYDVIVEVSFRLENSVHIMDILNRSAFTTQQTPMPAYYPGFSQKDCINKLIKKLHAINLTGKIRILK